MDNWSHRHPLQRQCSFQLCALLNFLANFHIRFVIDCKGRLLIKVDRVRSRLELVGVGF